MARRRTFAAAISRMSANAQLRTFVPFATMMTEGGSMAAFWREIVDTVDGQLSGDPSRRWLDLRPIVGWPLLIGTIVAMSLPQGSSVASIALIATLLVEAAWIVFLFRRWRVKAAEFVPATRFSDDPAGYT
jgi:hypothetical protein